MRTLCRPKDPITFLLGKPVRGASIFPEVFDRLRRHGREVRVHLPHETGDFLPAWLLDAALIVHRGLNPAALAALSHLEQTGRRCCNRIAATLATQNRYKLQQQLAAAGLPIPWYSMASTWSEVRAHATERAIVAKTVDGSRGRGTGVDSIEAGWAAAQAPFPGPYLVQERIVNDGWDRKLYVAGLSCRGLLKAGLRRNSGGCAPFAPTPVLCELALAVGQALGLEIYGVDFVMGRQGPLIVDVNVFPGFKGLPDAGQLIGDYLHK